MKRMTDGTVVISVPEDDLDITGRVILEAGRWCKTFYPDEPRMKGRWIDYTDDGYVECPFCGSATNCDGDISELHYCFSCGADMREEGEQR